MRHHVSFLLLLFGRAVLWKRCDPFHSSQLLQQALQGQLRFLRGAILIVPSQLQLSFNSCVIVEQSDAVLPGVYCFSVRLHICTP